MVTCVDAATGLVVTSNLWVVDRGRKRTRAGTLAIVGWLLARATGTESLPVAG
jgi:hypothetical protein